MNTTISKEAAKLIVDNVYAGNFFEFSSGSAAHKDAFQLKNAVEAVTFIHNLRAIAYPAIAKKPKAIKSVKTKASKKTATKRKAA